MRGWVWATLALLAPSRALAWGCFVDGAQSNPTVATEERVLFALDGQEVTAIVQMAYDGSPASFGWVAPVPSLPTLEVGASELFTELTTRTAPTFLVSEQAASCPPPTMCEDDGGGCGGPIGPSGGCSFDLSGGDDAWPSRYTDASRRVGDGGAPAIAIGQLGPYDYAILAGDSADAVLAWLSDNGFELPTGGATALARYVGTGGYFVALKLAAGRSTGDLEPVTFHYQAQVPSIPIALTAPSSAGRMAISVWALASARVVSSSYADLTLDEAALDWQNARGSYEYLVRRAVEETPPHQAFVTEYAGTSTPMVDVLDPAGRFGDESALAQIGDAATYVGYLRGHGFLWDDELVAILAHYIQVPPEVYAAGATAGDFFDQIAYWTDYVDRVRAAEPSCDAGTVASLDAGLTDDAGAMSGDAGSLGDGGNLVSDASRPVDASARDGGVCSPGLYVPTYDAAALTAEIWARIATPTLEAGALFRKFPTLSRLYTVMSPVDMTLDPAFVVDAARAPVPREHHARLVDHCVGPPTLVTVEQGWVVQDPGDAIAELTLPAAQLVTPPDGSTAAMLDHTAEIEQALDAWNARHAVAPPRDLSVDCPPRQTGCSCGCHVGGGTLPRSAFSLVVALLAVRTLRRRRRRRR